MQSFLQKMWQKFNIYKKGKLCEQQRLVAQNTSQVVYDRGFPVVSGKHLPRKTPSPREKTYPPQIPKTNLTS